MKGQTKIFIYLLIILSFITLFSISCNNNKDKTGTGERKLSYYAGNWWGKRQDETTETNILTINHDGSFNFKAGSDPDLKISSDSVTRVSDTNYTASYNETNSGINFTLIFINDTQGKLIMEFTTYTNSVDITKKQ
ncbi:hypothetical protein EPJ74_07630 [Brachyspira aalborgi]|uniref:Uncharacterized protein n=1 Tax=Brachyspira aalborgi TaxID=29522 RepID=A0A5C8GDQ8_9SPIR|nr:hypothetical protein [Brachyspira aalborgi]TXJ52479.1 hypothetical protein EPJ84_02330 [Brachyspira aalborgi]TXJ60071.1 hypothetical protein EPJ74_07630 [Brachyspira aalborgi]